MSLHSLRNSPLESSFVVVAFTENYSTSKTLKVSPEKSHILSCDTIVTLLSQMSDIYLAKCGRLHTPHLGENFGSCCQRCIGCCRRSYSTLPISEQNAMAYTVYISRCLTHIVMTGMLTPDCFKLRDDYCFVAKLSDMRIIPKSFPYLRLYIQELCCSSTTLRNIIGRNFVKRYTYT